MKRVVFFTAAIVLLLGLGLIGAEILAQGYAYFVVKRGKRFQPDDRLGWILIPNLDIRHTNANGDLYSIQTDALLIRGPSSFPSSLSISRILVVGDSFAFGEGVNLEDRFDSVLMTLTPKISIVNIGVPGYGTDQELLRAREELKRLGKINAILLLFCGNDLHDVARTRHSGRSKPWYELSGNSLIRHDPEIGLVEQLRDKSYLFSVFAAQFEHDPLYKKRLPGSLDIIRMLLQDFSIDVKSRGIELWIAVHGMNAFELPVSHDAVIKTICDIADRCFDLDPILTEAQYFLRDGHWSAEGHRAVAAYFVDQLQIKLP